MDPETWLYIVECADGAFYVGTTRATPELREWQHNAGLDPKAFTAKRRPVKLVFAKAFVSAIDAIAAERRVKGWSRDKKRALIDGRVDLLPMLAKRGREVSGD
jgi:putative endonuclease